MPTPTPTPIWGFETCTHETVREQCMYSAIRANWCGSEEEEKGRQVLGSRTSVGLCTKCPGIVRGELECSRGVGTWVAGRTVWAKVGRKEPAGPEHGV